MERGERVMSEKIENSGHDRGHGNIGISVLCGKRKTHPLSAISSLPFQTGPALSQTTFDLSYFQSRCLFVIRLVQCRSQARVSSLGDHFQVCLEGIE